MTPGRAAPAHDTHGLPRWPGQCFGCSPRNPHGLHLHVEPTREGCVASHTLASHFCGVEGIAHGGIVSTLLDEIAAWALILHTQRLGLTTDMNVTFAKPVRTLVPLEVEARVIAHDARQAETRAEVRGPDGAVLASATARWALASAGVVARMSGLPRASIEEFFRDAAHAMTAVPASPAGTTG